MKTAITFKKYAANPTSYASKYDVFHDGKYIGTIYKSLGGNWFTTEDSIALGSKAEAVACLAQRVPAQTETTEGDCSVKVVVYPRLLLEHAQIGFDMAYIVGGKYQVFNNSRTREMAEHVIRNAHPNAIIIHDEHATRNRNGKAA